MRQVSLLLCVVGLCYGGLVKREAEPVYGVSHHGVAVGHHGVAVGHHRAAVGHHEAPRCERCLRIQPNSSVDEVLPIKPLAIL